MVYSIRQGRRECFKDRVCYIFSLLILHPIYLSLLFYIVQESTNHGGVYELAR